MPAGKTPVIYSGVNTHSYIIMHSFYTEHIRKGKDNLESIRIDWTLYSKLKQEPFL